jgi:hypothetical protein
VGDGRARVKVKPTKGGVRLDLPRPVREITAHLVGQVSALLAEDRAEDTALQRLLPDAYADDDDAAEEFRRLTSDDLVARKRADAEVVLATSEATDLTVDQAESWLRALTDVRLVLADRLGIVEDGQAEAMWDAVGPDLRELLAVLHDLGWVQEMIIVALDAGGH